MPDALPAPPGTSAPCQRCGAPLTVTGGRWRDHHGAEHAVGDGHPHQPAPPPSARTGRCGCGLPLTLVGGRWLDPRGTNRCTTGHAHAPVAHPVAEADRCMVPGCLNEADAYEGTCPPCTILTGQAESLWDDIKPQDPAEPPTAADLAEWAEDDAIAHRHGP